jgi:hypothetical protein
VDVADDFYKTPSVIVTIRRAITFIQIKTDRLVGVETAATTP